MMMSSTVSHYPSSPRGRLQRGLALVSLFMSVLWLAFYEHMGIAYPLNRSLYVLLIVASVAASLAPVRLRERAVELGASVYLAVLLVAWLDAFYHSYGSINAQFAILKVVLWLPAVYGAFFLVYSPKVARTVAWAGLGAFMVTSVPHALTTAGGTRLFDGFLLPLALLIGHGACIAALYTFTRPYLSTPSSGEDIAQLQKLAYYDMLTGVPNRRQMNLLLENALLEARKGSSFAVMMIDFDHFKQVNDVFGHGVGDVVLSTAVQRLTGQLRSGDALGSWGGEEFIVLARHVGGSDALRRAEQLREVIGARPLVGEYAVTVSCGVAVYRPGDTLEQLIRRADRALYEAKRKGRNRVEATLSEAE